MSLAQYVTLGASGLRVSPLCLGAMTFGPDLGWGSTVEESQAILDRYIGRGGNFIDTANVYTFGHSEKIIGDPNGGGAGRKSIVHACEESLRRLQTDYIDLYWMHAWDFHTPIEETMRAFDDLVRDGKIRYVGISDTPAWKVAQAQMIARFRGWAPVIALQIEYSLVERTVEGELIPMARELGLGVTPWSPLKSGVLSGKYTRANHGKQKAARGIMAEMHLNDRTYDIIDMLIAIAKEIGTTPARVALAWVQGRPGVTSTIIGARSVDHLDANIGALDVKLSAEHVAMLDALTKPQLGFPMAFLDRAPMFMHGGISVNGVEAPVSPLAPKPDSPRY